MTDIIEQARKALEVATPAPWTVDEESLGAGCGKSFSVLYNSNLMVEVAEGVTTEEDARLIALAPDLARIAIAADELAKAVDHERNLACQDMDMQLQALDAVDNALDAYQAAKEWKTND